MMESNDFYSERMNWLTEIQFFRKDLQKAKLKLHALKINNDQSRESKMQFFYDSIFRVDEQFNTIEKHILFSLNNGQNYWVDSFGNNAKPGNVITRENELFDTMKKNFTDLMDLLKTINSYLNDNMIHVYNT